MKLWIVKDAYLTMLVRAESEDEAVQLAQQSTNGPLERVTCTALPVDGEPGVLLTEES